MTSVTPVTIALNPRRKAHCVPLVRKTQKHSGWLAHSYASAGGQMGKRVKVPSRRWLVLHLLRVLLAQLHLHHLVQGCYTAENLLVART